MSLSSVFKNRVIVPSKRCAFLVSNGSFKLGISSFFSLAFKDTKISEIAGRKYQNLLVEKLKSDFSYVIEKYKN